MILCHMISHSSLFKKEKTPTKMVFSHHFCESPIIPFPPCLSIQRCGKRKIHKLSGSCQFQHRVNCMMKRSVSKHFSSYLTNHLVTHITVSPCRIFYLVLHFFFFFFKYIKSCPAVILWRPLLWGGEACIWKLSNFHLMLIKKIKRKTF